MKHNHTHNSANKHRHDDNHQPSGFFYREDVIRWILRIFYAGALALLLVDFFIHRHIVTDVEKLPTFYALYGFVACVVLVVIAKWMRIFLIRSEDYYDEFESPEDFLQNQGLDLPEVEHNHAHQESESASKKTTTGEEAS